MPKNRALNHKHAYMLANRFADQAVWLAATSNTPLGKPPKRKIATLRSSLPISRPSGVFVNPDAEPQRWKQQQAIDARKAISANERTRKRREKRKRQRARSEAGLPVTPQSAP